MLQDPQVHARNMVVPTDDPSIDNLKYHGNPMKFSCYPDAKSRPKAPELDEHREQILKEIGLRETSKL